MEACLGVLEAGAPVGGLSEDELAAAFEDGTRMAGAAEDPRALALLTSRHGMMRGMRGEWRRSMLIEAQEEAARLSDGLEDLSAELEVFWRLAIAHGQVSATGALADADAGLERAASEGVRPGSHEFSYYIRLLGQRVSYLRLLGRLEAAEQEGQRSLELAVDAGHVISIVFGHSYLGAVAGAMGDADAALQHSRRAAEAAERIDVPFVSMFAYGALGEAHLLRQEFEQVVDLQERALAILRDHRVGGSEGVYLAGLAEAYVGQGDYDRAREYAQRAVEQASGSGALRCRLSLARVLLVSPGLDAASEIERALDEAAGEIERGDWHVHAPEVHVERAALAGLRGDEPERLHHLREAHRLYTEIGATGHAERVAQELAALPS